MTALALDASAAASLVLPDERSDAVARVLEALPELARIVVPALWWYELANVLAVAVRCGRIKEADSIRAWNLLCALEPVSDARTGPLHGLELVELAGRHGLSAYDAAYLELAMRTGAPLCTLDGPLRDAAERAGVRVVPA